MVVDDDGAAIGLNQAEPVATDSILSTATLPCPAALRRRQRWCYNVRMSRKRRLAVVLLLCTCVLLAALPLAWLLGQPDGGSRPVEGTLDAAYVQAVRHDPAHRAFYGRIYFALGDVTASDQVHYVVHRAAALLALLVGDRAGAQDQENRAAQHAPG